ncbi:MAG: YecA family protein [Bacteroidota bacterium]
MKKYKNTHWAELETEDFYDAFEEIGQEEEKAELLLYLISNHPEKEVSYFEMMLDIIEPLLFHEKPHLVESLSETYKKAFPEEYENDYQYIETRLVDYYFYKNNPEKIKERLEIVKQYPVEGIDTVTINCVHQLLYHQHYDTLLDFSGAVWKPIFESEDIIGSAHNIFTINIYLQKLEKAYERVKKNEKVDWKKFFEDTRKYDFHETEESINIIVDCIEKPFDRDEIINLIENKQHREINMWMNMMFSIYMKEKYGLPFMLSDQWWNILVHHEIFLGSNNVEDHFYIDFLSLKEHFLSHLDKMFESNLVDIFGKIWGLAYIYDFFKDYELISDDKYNLMMDNIRGLKFYFLNHSLYNLWQMQFIFQWPNQRNPEMQELFQKTFSENSDDYAKAAYDYLLKYSQCLSESVKYQINKHKPENKQAFSESVYSGPDTYVKSAPKVGRNDPCPCESGKKYKKCCGSNI